MCNENDCKEDPNIKLWKRFKEASTSEKGWMHERLSWLFTPQVILFSAFALIYDSRFEAAVELKKILKLIIPAMGIGTSVVVLIGTCAAAVMHWKWTSRLNDIAKEINGEENFKAKGKIIVSFGTPPYWPARTSSILPCILPALFIIAWFVVICKSG
jgi:hypothetical protein